MDLQGINKGLGFKVYRYGCINVYFKAVGLDRFGETLPTHPYGYDLALVRLIFNQTRKDQSN